ncbi:heme A synthase [Maricaulis sp. W15]|uniref:Heme A synthase n=1 Tax=Maricaulis maris TaxID=74318 RepID=A0A495DJS4_9PROT|nr:MULTISPECIES: COX15/CtaA family protein [Maricaulis]OLF78025.1 heme A synthase [Maricaulis sp. W15]RKR02870.1 cytochrome c oxidase assembly protein subunit 15 [Maricaulis maris]
MSYHSSTTSRAVSLWLLVVAALVCAMIIIGGTTRLTDSGLSITEWKPISGAIPPLSQADWEREFSLYQQTTEFQVQNSAMTLAEFEFIFWWEWGHRQLGRLIGLVYFVPFVFFWLRGHLSARLKPRLFGLFLLGGAQGAIGWWMVASGLSDRLDVSQYRLATHLGMAFIILGASIWLSLEARFGPPPLRRGRLAGVTTGLLALIFVQVLLGAFVAGLDAGRIYNTWPLMNGELIPSDYLGGMSFLPAIFESHAAVQMHHRWMAYLVALCVFAHAVLIWREPRVSLKPFMIILPALVIGQMALGIAALVSVVPLHLSLAHQAGAILLFSATVWAAWTARRAV